MGAHVRGAGTDVIRIEGVPVLRATNVHTIIPDRIEAGTYLAMAAAMGDGVQIHNIIPEHLESFTAKLIEMGVDLQIGEDSAYVGPSKNLKAIQVKTLPFPGFATDLQQPITPLLLMAKGSSVIVDTIYPQRLKHVPELKKMGAKIRPEKDMVIVDHTDHLTGATVDAGEIRAGAALMIAALMADGTTTITSAENILRGYGSIVEKMTALNADVKIKDTDRVEEL